MSQLDDPAKRRILQALQANGRLSNQELAEQVSLSASPCWRRVKELEQSGIIRRYAAILDPEMAGAGICVFTQINIEKHKGDMLADLEARVRARPEILECYAITGDADFIIKVQVADIKAYDRLLQEFIFQIPGVSHVKSNFTLREIKYETALPLPE